MVETTQQEAQEPAPHRVTRITAFLAIDPEDGEEGIMAMRTPTGEWLPMVGSSASAVESMRQVAEGLKAEQGIQYEERVFEAKPMPDWYKCPKCGEIQTAIDGPPLCPRCSPRPPAGRGDVTRMVVLSLDEMKLVGDLERRKREQQGGAS